MITGFGWNGGLMSPCKGCKDRHAACHDECARYAAFRKELESLNKAKELSKAKESFAIPLGKRKRR